MKTKFDELNFNGVLIQLIQSDGFDMMINATEMWKSYCGGKTDKKTQPYEFLRLQSTINLINAFKNEPEFSRYTPVITIKGNYADGTRQGTWMHRWIAIEYAQWLDPKFSLWCNQRIDELLRTGFTVALDNERARYNSIINGIKPKADYYDEVLTYSGNLYSTEQLCKDLGFGFGPKKLLARLEELGYIYRKGRMWFLKSPYDNEGYTKVISQVVVDKKTGKKHSVNKKRWTEQGKRWIWSLEKKL